MANKEYVCMEETPANTQKLIKTWVATGYTIKIVYQQAHIANQSSNATTIVLTSLWRTK